MEKWDMACVRYRFLTKLSLYIYTTFKIRKN